MVWTTSSSSNTATEAGAGVVRNRFGTRLARIDKGGGDFATDVDVDAEDTIMELLLASRPTDQVVAEESGRVGVPGSAAVGSSTRCVAVDIRGAGGLAVFASGSSCAATRSSDATGPFERPRAAVAAADRSRIGRAARRGVMQIRPRGAPPWSM